ncbi:MAG TPA: gamma-glutamylcyclotransferase [bacterium]|nr:gamma-glutamylcyclotransferase [bacterium]
MTQVAAPDTAPPLAGLTWFFGYGSLIWRPGFSYAERRPALLSGYHRAFCRYSFRHRGTPEHPGLVIGLREGGSCVGVAYGVAAPDVPAALDYLDEREGAGYLRREQPLRLGLEGAGPEVTAWVYIPNPEHPSYFGEQDFARLVALVAGGHGESGTALDYLRDLIAHLAEMGITEPELAHVLAAAQRHARNERLAL